MARLISGDCRWLPPHCTLTGQGERGEEGGGKNRYPVSLSLSDKDAVLMDGRATLLTLLPLTSPSPSRPRLQPHEGLGLQHRNLG